MKIREFNIENYNVEQKVKKMVRDKVTHVEMGGIVFSVSLQTYNVRVEQEDFDKLDKKTKDIITKHFKDEYDIKSKEVIERYKKVKKYADKILFDDKEFNELCIVLEDNYYCQAISMIEDVITSKTKGKSMKALKYNARKLQADDVSCD